MYYLASKIRYNFMVGSRDKNIDAEKYVLCCGKN